MNNKQKINEIIKRIQCARVEIKEHKDEYGYSAIVEDYKDFVDKIEELILD